MKQDRFAAWQSIRYTYLLALLTSGYNRAASHVTNQPVSVVKSHGAKKTNIVVT